MYYGVEHNLKTDNGGYVKNYFFLRSKDPSKLLHQMCADIEFDKMSDTDKDAYVAYPITSPAPEYDVYNSTLKTKESLEEILNTIDESTTTVQVTWVVEPVSVEMQQYRLNTHNFQVLNTILSETGNILDKFVMPKNKDTAYMFMIDIAPIFNLYTAKKLTLPLNIPVLLISKPDNIDITDDTSSIPDDKFKKTPGIYVLTRTNIEGFIDNYMRYLQRYLEQVSDLSTMMCSNYRELVFTLQNPITT